ncbi:methyladenine glycosylase family protein [Dorcoceras hygrometricum]|uniref:Methyladenine glycosylase family protein n=1 Tax=Dorcoceras hygrometricum TaxID=472368 RepID=A0A2Z7A6M6_9LAMI|nr:methyladenine glycosylase family protein [Dorcoceras hygrometricum]
MNSKQTPSRCLLFFSLKPVATTSRSIHEKTSQNDTVPTNLNEIVALHQLVHQSLAKQPKAGTRSLQANNNGWLREINQNDDALTNPNDIIKVTSASLPPAGSPVTTHFSQQSLAAGSIRNTQNAAFQLNETTSLHFYDWFPKPAAGHSKFTHLLIQQSITQKC